MFFVIICFVKVYYGLSDFYNVINNFDCVLNKIENNLFLYMRFLVFESFG